MSIAVAVQYDRRGGGMGRGGWREGETEEGREQFEFYCKAGLFRHP